MRIRIRIAIGIRLLLSFLFVAVAVVVVARTVDVMSVQRREQSLISLQRNTQTYALIIIAPFPVCELRQLQLSAGVFVRFQLMPLLLLLFCRYQLFLPRSLSLLAWNNFDSDLGRASAR